MDLIKLGEILKNKRNHLGLSLRDAGDLIGVSHNYLSILEKAKDPRSNAPITPTIDTLRLIADAYNLDINYLLPLAGYEDIVLMDNSEHYNYHRKENKKVDIVDEFLLDLKKKAAERGIEFDPDSAEDLLDFYEFMKKREDK